MMPPRNRGFIFSLNQKGLQMHFAEIAIGGVANRGVILRDIKLQDKIEERIKKRKWKK